MKTILALLLAAASAATPTSIPTSTPTAIPAPAASASVFTDADAAPLFTAGPLAKARADFESERWEAAAKGFERAGEPEARYLRAVALVEAHRVPAALKALAGLEEKLPELADRITFWRARAHELAGEARPAASAYAAVGEGSLLWADAQLARARALQVAGDRAAALDALAPILSLPPPEEVTRGDTASEALLLDGRLRASGKGKADLTWARRAFVECWAGHPLSTAAQTCLAELKKLPRSASAPPTAEETLRRDEALLDANRNAPALAELVKLVATLPPPGDAEPLACRARFALGKAYRKERQHAKAIEILKPVVERCEDPQLRVRAVYVLASASSIVAPEEGVVWYRALARDYPAHPFADDALFYAADLLARSGHAEEALAALADLSEKYPKGDFRAEALFRIAWIERSAGHADSALASLSRLERDYEASDPYEHARASYWHARILRDRGGEGDAARAEALWHALAERYPADYYGLLARARLEEGKPGSAPSWPRVEAVADDGGG
ncbi:MAG TPA: tetratricopeptide repeat protein, partial [Anaeromyxobacteraceae bacterium]